MQFGTTKTTKILDNNGSTETIEEKIVSGEVNKPVRKYYEIKTRVHNQREEHAAYLAFSDDLQNDASKHDPAFRIEHNQIGTQNGYYYVVSCYSQLEY